MNAQGESDASYDNIIMQLGGEGDLSKSHLQDDNNRDTRHKFWGHPCNPASLLTTDCRGKNQQRSHYRYILYIQRGSPGMHFVHQSYLIFMLKRCLSWLFKKINDELRSMKSRLIILSTQMILPYWRIHPKTFNSL